MRVWTYVWLFVPLASSQDQFCTNLPCRDVHGAEELEQLNDYIRGLLFVREHLLISGEGLYCLKYVLRKQSTHPISLCMAG